MFRRLMVGTAVMCGVVAWQAPAAFPWYSLISAKMSCDGTVDWTASAWNGPTPDSRYNPDVLVSISFDHGFTYKRVAERAFDQSDNYQFAGLYPAGSAYSVVLRVQELANWPAAGGDVPGPPHYAKATRPSNCPAPKAAVKAAHHTVADTKTPTKTTKPTNTTTKASTPHKKTAPVKSTPQRKKPKRSATLPFTK